MLFNVKLVVSWYKGLPFKIADFFGLFNFEWQNQNKVGNAGIFVLWRGPEKLEWFLIFQFFFFPNGS